jgi:SOS-response transcriptional repressor LexA
MARQYQRKKHLLKQINEMLESGMTQREIADELGLTGYRPVHELLKRERNKKVPGIPKPKGLPRVRTLTTNEDYEHEIAKLKMENKLLRDFLQSTERM